MRSNKAGWIQNEEHVGIDDDLWPDAASVGTRPAVFAVMQSFQQVHHTLMQRPTLVSRMQLCMQYSVCFC